MRRQVLLVALIVVLGVGSIVFLLTTGGVAPTSDVSDPSGDAVQGPGPAPPTQPPLADVVRAEVRRDGNEVIFESQLSAPVPNKIKGGELEVRWDLFEEGQATWMVAGSIDIGPSASIISHETNYGVGTFDDTLPGGIQVDGDTVRIRLRPAEIEDFPTEFDWALSTSLDGDRGEAQSARVEDRTPDSGFGTYTSQD